MSTVLMKSKNQCWGDYFGYPKCCIKAFHTMLIQDIKFNQISIERKRATKYGFVPCQRCAQKILEGKIKVEDCILPTRQCPKPFTQSV